MNLLRRIRLTEKEREELMGFRRQALLECMREISEGCWAASWHDGLEADLYRIVFEGASPEYGMSMITPAELERLSHYAAVANCWFSRSNEAMEPLPISLDEARTRYQRICPQGGAGRTVQEVVDIYEKSRPQDWARIVEPEVPDEKAGPFLDWLYRASEAYKYCHDPLIQLVRRDDLSFDLRYSCDIRIVDPCWLPKWFPRADGCTPTNPCGKTRRCVSCAHTGKVEA